MAVADFDGDGEEDVAVAEEFIYSGSPGAGIEILTGDGAGGFTPVELHSTGDHLNALEVGDLNGDGVLDLIAPAENQNGSAVLYRFEGHGDGTFSGLPQVPLTECCKPGNDVVLFDFDLDGNTDFAACQGQNRVNIFRGTGGFSYQLLQILILPSPPSTSWLQEVEAADIDSDGDPELLTTADAHLRAYELTQSGFAPVLAYPLAHSLSTHGYLLVSMSVGDLNADTVPDVALTELISGALLAGDGQGGFTKLAQLPYNNGAVLKAIDLADLDADGVDELAIGLEGNVVRFADWDGTELRVEDYSTGVELGDLGLAEVDGDGQIDLLLAGSDPFGPAGVLVVSPGIAPLEHDLPRALMQTEFYGGGAVAYSSDFLRLAAADVNHDGNGDLVSLVLFGVEIYAGNPAGELTSAISFPLSNNNLPSAVDLADLDGDGTLDLFGPKGPVNDGLLVLPGLGDGTFGAPITPWSGAIKPSQMATADLDHDGSLDIVLASSKGLAVLRAGAGGSFSESQFLTNGVHSMALPDLDTDGTPDLALHEIAPPDDRVLTFLGTGAASFGAPSSQALPILFDSLMAELDYDGDGDDDLLISSHATLVGQQGSVILSDGSGALSAADVLLLSPDEEILSIRPADLDADGDPDVLGTDEVGRLVLYENNGVGGLAHKVIGRSNVQSAFDPVILDLAGDGRPDVIVGHREVAAVLENAAQPPPASLGYGSGTPACHGLIGIAATTAPTVGAADFAVRATGAHPETPGFALLSPGTDTQGSDPLGLGLITHVDIFSGSFFLFSAQSDAAGLARAPMPIPPIPGLATQVLGMQFAWLPPSPAPCSTSPLGLTSSRGLRVVIQP